MKEIKLEKLHTEKLKFWDLPDEIIDELSDPLGHLLTPVAFENIRKGRMTILAWRYKFRTIRDLLK